MGIFLASWQSAVLRSRILHETRVWLQVVPEDDVKAAGPIANMDMSIMTAATGLERTRAAWVTLLQQAELKMLRVDTPAPGQPSFIYACTA
jgi:hypothetical protein